MDFKKKLCFHLVPGVTSLRFRCTFGAASQLGRTQWGDSRPRRTMESML